MRLNFNPATAAIVEIPDWLDDLQNQWLLYYGIDTTYNNRTVNGYKWSTAGARHFAEWLSYHHAFKVDYWEIDYIPEESKAPVAYGIVFDENCPRFIEEVLKQG